MLYNYLSFFLNLRRPVCPVPDSCSSTSTTRTTVTPYYSGRWSSSFTCQPVLLPSLSVFPVQPTAAPLVNSMTLLRITSFTPTIQYLSTNPKPQISSFQSSIFEVKCIDFSGKKRTQHLINNVPYGTDTNTAVESRISSNLLILSRV